MTSIGHAGRTICFCANDTVARDLLPFECGSLDRRRARAVSKIRVSVVRVCSGVAILDERHQTISTTTTAGSSRSCEQAMRGTRRGVPLWLLLLRLLTKRQGFGPVSVGIRLVTTELGFAELIQVFAARRGVVWIVHGDVPGRLAAMARCLEILTISAF